MYRCDGGGRSKRECEWLSAEETGVAEGWGWGLIRAVIYWLPGCAKSKRKCTRTFAHGSARWTQHVKSKIKRR